MIPDRNKPNDPSSQASTINVSTQSPTVALSGPSSAIHKSFAMTPLSDIPPRPSTAPPHPALDAIVEPQTDLQTHTTLVSNLRARNLLLQKAISRIDDAVLHLMAARSGIPSSRMQQVRGEARNRKDLLDRVERAIKMAQNGELPEESRGEDTSSGSSSLAGTERPLQQADALFGFGSTSAAPPNLIYPPSSDDSDAHQLRRASSQPQLGPSTTERQACTLPVLIERRKILQESIDSWHNFVAELRVVQPHLEAQALSTLSEASTATASSSAQSEEPSSWVAKYQRAQFEIKRREGLLLRLNQAITQFSNSPHAIPSPEQVTALATYMPPPLDKARFDVVYAQFCQGKSVQMNTSIIMPDVTRPVIDVYSLHVAVMQEGSFTRVSTRKSWDLVGARLGFIQTAATATEPARSSAEIATHLEKVYRDRLQQFDHLYVSSVIETVRKRMAEQQNRG